jgi:hypothetical protein
MKKRQRDNTSDSEDSVCYYCGEPGHRVPKCPVKQKAIAARRKPRKTESKKEASPEPSESTTAAY